MKCLAMTLAFVSELLQNTICKNLGNTRKGRHPPPPPTHTHIHTHTNTGRSLRTTQSTDGPPHRLLTICVRVVLNPAHTSLMMPVTDSMNDFSVTVSGRAVWPQARLRRRASADIPAEPLPGYGGCSETGRAAQGGGGRGHGMAFHCLYRGY